VTPTSGTTRSGSGKSTYAIELVKANPGTVRVNRDKLREMYFGSEEDYGINEDLITRAQNNAIMCALSAGCDVVVDNTFIEWEHVENVAQIAKGRKAEVVIIDFDIPLDMALVRNANRTRVVPEHVIRRQYERYQETIWRQL
jgi:predicted kinase